MGLVTGASAHRARTHIRWVTSPGRTPRGWAVGLGRAPISRRPTPRQEAPLPRRPRAAQKLRKAS